MRVFRRSEQSFVPALLVALFVPQGLGAQTLGYDKHRIACSADGNHQSERHPEASGTSGDPDDWGATAASLTIIAKHGLQDKLVHYSFNNFMGAPAHTTSTNEMKISANEGAERLGFDKTRFFDVGEKRDEAISHLAAELAKSTEGDPLYFIHMGPAEFFYRAVKAVMDDGKAGALKHVQIISHSGWNDNHKRRRAHHTMVEVIALSGDRLKFKKIVDQNAGWKSDYSKWHWMRDHADKNVQWIYKRADHHPAKVFDISDCGMVFYLLEGDERGNSSKFREFIGDGIESLAGH